jgi:hypothetical protein
MHSSHFDGSEVKSGWLFKAFVTQDMAALFFSKSHETTLDSKTQLV